MGSHAHRLKIQNDISTYTILPLEKRGSTREGKETVKALFAGLEEDFAKRIKNGDYLVAGSNFGCGPDAEQAVLALKSSGVGAVVAKSFSRIFYRSAMNWGLSLIECETNYIDDMDELSLDLDRNCLMNLSKGVRVDIKPVPKMLKKMLSKGGVIQYFRDMHTLSEVA